jgi:S-adenosylmethionine synthetase
MKLITAESVSIGHPDKVADQISDAILDAYLTLDPDAKVAVETLVKDNCVVLGGEISSTHRINYEEVIKNTVKEIGYTNPGHGFYYKNITIINLIGQQSREINNAVLKNSEDSLGAGDQGFMTGYATNETNTYMPIGMYVSKKLVDYVYNNIGFGPDIKTQTTIEYDDITKRIHTILVSTMHSEDLTLSNVRQIIMKGIKNNDMNLDADIFALIDDRTSIVINPAGSWNVGGPVADCGVTGRKIVVDQYGPYNPVGGGAFSGKDPSKVDRTGAYLARYIAKNIVAAGYTDKCAVEIAYMIGVDKPASLSINTFGQYSDDWLEGVVCRIFPLTPSQIINHFKLKRPIYLESSRGHFGNDIMPWEKLDKIEDLKRLAVIHKV